MNSIEQIQQAFVTHVKTTLALDDESLLQQCQLLLNLDEAKQEFGNLSTSIAMILARPLKRNPREIAERIIENFVHPLVKRIEIAGPGFINLYVVEQTFSLLAQELFEQKESFFKLDKLEKKYNYSLEFVSANPTGPLHVGHGRGGIIGDVLGNVLRFVGHTVTKEFYINDAGVQMHKLGESFKIRCFQAAGKHAVMIEDGYHGEYLLDLARQCLREQGEEVLARPESFFVDYAKHAMLEAVKQTLNDYGIHYDVWFSEKTLHESGAIETALAVLQKKDLLFESDGAIWFKTTAFGDDKDRVVKKFTGEYTYVAADIAYLGNKIERGANNLIFVLGHDHHSYVARLNAVKNGLGFGNIPLDVILYQLVKITESGQLVRMSKRAGNMVMLRDIIDAVGKDVARFFYLNRKADAQLEFDLELALKKTEENPVYYVQYAYVRTGSILAKALTDSGFDAIVADDAQYVGMEEAYILKKIVFLKTLINDIATNHQTHLLTYYVLELAHIFHRYYSNVRVIDLTNKNKSSARLLVIIIVRETIATVLKVLGISCPDKM